MALATAADYKLRAGVSGTDSDALITELIADATAEISRYCGRELESATVTDEYGDGAGEPYLLVNRYPVTSVTSIAVRSGDSTYTTLAATDYEIRGDGSAGVIDIVSSSALWNISGRWGDGGGFGGDRGGRRNNSYKITYVGGYLSGTHDTELQALKAIVCDMVAAMSPTDPAARANSRLYQSENVGYQSWTYRPASEVLSQFEGRLDRFRRVSL